MSVNRVCAVRLVAGALGLTLVGAALTSCAAGSGAETIRFTFSKREAIGFMTELVAEYNASQDDVEVVIDTSGVDVVSASFVRGNPPDIMLANYNYEIARFVQRCALTDLSETDAAATIRDDLQPLMDQYGSCAGRTSALPYSVMAASVIYNKEIFDAQGLEVPQTWDELIAVCDQLKDAGIDPFYGTFKDDWTVGQGWYDYTAGGSVDVIDFFDALAQEGTGVGPDSEVSFQKDFAEPMDRMMQLADEYTNPDAASRGYGDGNLAFAKGEAAMYLQGPWAFSEIAKTAPDLELGTFPLPMTDDPADLGVRVNMDLAAMIPEGSRHQEAARDFLEYLYQPDHIQEYNTSQLGFTPTKDAPAPDDPRIEGMIEYYDNGQIYQGPSVLVPKTLPIFNYAQAMVLGASTTSTLRTMDADWARIAFRAPLPSTQDTASGDASASGETEESAP
ncbi:ABC transporter substrate-binding protein [Microbacterium saperdae]|uniref:Carbohydrate ABC transporter substrate-binding protein (CUT1 family) n=1 Tax=Microbacterium saperdae TaxID=69368 RepID=A0A543B9Y6_9MICO|nr:ABC transporter substrate-binding protein [Microbacterium saperdae]TQL81665.1 carbohydrate ABC transporter substrate-binding protein (CUT1 family) [Microbacterium saperdae]GGM33825.1 carbohydrate-binding protein [Microbacterium saperdae]